MFGFASLVYRSPTMIASAVGVTDSKDTVRIPVMGCDHSSTDDPTSITAGIVNDSTDRRISNTYFL